MATAYRDVAAAGERVALLVGQLRPRGRVLELACGTGLWTEALAAAADTVLALDAAPEALAIARDRVRSANVTFEAADVFSWTPAARFDAVFSRCGCRTCPRADSTSSGGSADVRDATPARSESNMIGS